MDLYQLSVVVSYCLLSEGLFKVSGPFVETSCVFQCIKNIINAEMWHEKTTRIR